VSSVLVWALAPAWGLLAAAPLVVIAKRVGATERARRLGVVPRRAVSAPGHRVPGPVRRFAVAVQARRELRRAVERLGGELPLAVDLLQVAVGAGATPRRAVELTASWGPPAVAAELHSVLDATRLGGAFADALEAAGHDVAPLAPVTAVLVASDRLGAPVGQALTRLARELRADLRRRAETRARTLPVKLLFPLVFLVLPAFGLLTVVPALLQALART
jgi:pilus assembly protein TadC